MSSHIDTLKTYKDYLAAGYTESQAECATRSLNGSFEGVATTKDLLILETSLKYFFTWEIVGALMIALVFPIITKRLVK